jgi:guanylate kinase
LPKRVTWLDGEWPSSIIPERQTILFVVAGPSGAGKDTILGLLKAHDLHLHYVITTTTRPPRSTERDGVHYRFVDEAEFGRIRESGGFLEWAIVHEYLYGSPLADVADALSRGEDVLIKPDVQGAASIRLRIPEAVLIYVAPGNESELTARIHRRNSETEETYAARMSNMPHELEVGVHFDYVVVNRDGRVDQAVEDLRSIITAERMRVRPRACRIASRPVGEPTHSD